MKRIFIFITSLIAIHSLTAQTGLTGDLTIRVEAFQPGQGELVVALFNSRESFEKQEGPVYFRKTPVLSSGEHMDIVFSDILPGSYAVAIYQDLNKNGRIDKNMLGVPTEPYGFSGEGNHRWRPPGFGAARFDKGAGAVVQRIRMVSW